MDSETPCTIGLGSNTEDREFQITQAIEHLCGYFHRCAVSSVYESEAFNGVDKPYYNAVLHGYTNHSYDDVIKFLKAWEEECGRTQLQNMEGNIVIDLDLVIWDSNGRGISNGTTSTKAIENCWQKGLFSQHENHVLLVSETPPLQHSTL